MPKLLNRHHPNLPKDSVYVGRGTPFGNIYEYPKHGTRKQCVQKFAAWLATQPELIERVKTELVGKDLVCSCSPKRCHAEILLAIANNEIIQPVAETKEQVQLGLFN